MTERLEHGVVPAWRRFLEPFRTIPDRAGSIKSIAFLRGCAVLLVVWDHVIAGWTRGHGRSWIPLETVRDWFSDPLVIIQDFGFLGVAIFFLLSGYIISEVSTRESRAQFAIKRFLRIYPALIVSVLVLVGIDRIRPSFGLSDHSFGLAQSLWAMTLINYVRTAEGPVNGVAWSLVVEVLFYGLVFLCLPLLKRRPLVAVSVELLVVFVVILMAKDFPIDAHQPNFFLLAASVAYLPLLFIGQAVWLWRSGRTDGRVASAIILVSWLLFVLGMRRIHTSFLEPANSYGVSVIVAVVLFVVAVINEDRIRLPRWIAAISVVSYSAYLVHGPLTEIVMDRLEPTFPFTVNLVIALLVLAVVALLMWRMVELPSQGFARWLLAARSSRTKL
jgi:peptidoglycan/LPS O-acetylase OafA/YrhL